MDTKLRDLKVKYELLGFETTVISDTSLLVNLKLEDGFKGYSTKTGKIVETTIQNLSNIPGASDSNLLISVNYNKSIVMNNDFETQLTLNNERVILVALKRILLVIGMNSLALRLITIDGKNLLDGIISSMHIYRVNNELIVLAKRQMGTATLYKIYNIESDAYAKALFELTSNDLVFIGKDKIAIQYDSDKKIKIYGFDCRTKLVVNSGVVKEDIDKQAYLIFDKYNKLIYKFNGANKLF